MGNIQTLYKLWEKDWVKIITLIVIFILFWCIFNKKENPAPMPTIAVNENGNIIIINSKTGKKLPVTECSTREKGSNLCEAFRDKFKTEKIETVTILRSIREKNTRCCATYIFEGQAVELCGDVPENVTQCPPGWELKL